MSDTTKVEVSGHVSAGVIVEALILGLFISCGFDSASATVAGAVERAAWTSVADVCGGGQ